MTHPNADQYNPTPEAMAAHRQRCKMTQAEWAQAFNVTIRTVTNWETHGRYIYPVQFMAEMMVAK